MTREDFEKGIKTLEAGIGRPYKKETIDLFWEETLGEFAGRFLSVCRSLARTEVHLPNLALLKIHLDSNRSADEGEKRQRDDQRYLADCKTRAQEAEQIIGQSFASFLRANNGDGILAALYFGEAYHRIQGNKQLAASYEKEIERREWVLAHPEEARKQAKQRRKLDIAEKIKIGAAMDAAKAR